MGLARSTYYYRPQGLSAEKRKVEADLRDRIEEIALRFPRYGYRRMTRQLHREGFPVNHKVWVADLTYVRLRWEFVYLAVILDVFSRRVVGYALSRSLEASLTVAALHAALADRRPLPGCIHYCDRACSTPAISTSNCSPTRGCASACPGRATPMTTPRRRASSRP